MPTAAGSSSAETTRRVPRRASVRDRVERREPVAVEVDPAGDPRNRAVARVLPEGPRLAAPVAAGDGRARRAPVGDPQDRVAVVGEPAAVVEVVPPERRAGVD